MHKKRFADLKETIQWLLTTDMIPGNAGFNVDQWAQETDCGVRYCVIGWYIVQHPKNGLVMMPGGLTICSREHSHISTFTSIGQHFDIPTGLAEVLFNPNQVVGHYVPGDPDPYDRKFWAKLLMVRIRALERMHKKTPIKHRRDMPIGFLKRIAEIGVE